jgi:hypothetical protein
MVLSEFLRGLAVEQRVSVPPSLASSWRADPPVLRFLAECELIRFETAVHGLGDLRFQRLGVAPPQPEQFRAAYEAAGLPWSADRIDHGAYRLHGGAVFVLHHHPDGQLRINCGARTHDEIRRALVEAGYEEPLPVELDLWFD